MKYIMVELKTDDKVHQVILCFPRIINHDDFADMVKYHACDKFDEVKVIHAGFIRRINETEFRFACSGRSETLNLDSSIHDCVLINNRKDEYSIGKVSGVVGKEIAAHSFDGHHVGDKAEFTFILPNIFDIAYLWDDLKCVKLGNHRNWCRPFVDWSFELIKP